MLKVSNMGPVSPTTQQVSQTYKYDVFNYI